jgi:hypothetical protein
MTHNTKDFLNVAGLSFYDIKYNFINFLKSQSEFSDYNLEGSNLTVLLDILAYNTAQQGFYTTMVANEMFIDRASKRSSVVSLAKLMGYTPNTKRSAKAKVLLVVDAANVPDSKLLNRGSVFLGALNNSNYTFTNTNAYAFYPYTFDSTSDPDAAENGEILTYACGPVDIQQGILNTISYNVASYEEQFLIPDVNADKDSLRVFVMNSITDVTGITIPWFVSNDLTVIDENSKVFFLEENNLGKLVIQFGDGILGKKLETGNIIIIEYLSSAGSEANGIGKADTLTKRSFSIQDNTDITVLTIESSNSGNERESSASIKRNAVRNYTSRERAVTKKDYEGLVLAAFNNNAAVRCWGGDENDPPVYGKVFISVRPIGTTILAASEKNNLVTNILKTKNIVGLDVVVVDPEVLYINLNVTGYFDRVLTNDSSVSISKKIKDSLVIYFRKNLVEFGDSIYAQDIEIQAKNTSNSIKAVDVAIMLERKIIPTIGVGEKVIVNFQNKLYHPFDGHAPILTSNMFYLSGGSGSHYFEDDGNGVIVLKKKVGGITTTVSTTYGTIDYTTGKLTLAELKISGFAQGKSSIEIKAKPETSNIFTTKNSILEFDSLDNDSLIITMKEVNSQKV